MVARVTDAASESVAGDADVALVPAGPDERLADTARRLRAAGVPLLLVDVTVHLADSERTALRRIEKLDRRESADDDTLVFAGTGESLAGTVARWQSLGFDGARLRPGVNAVDLPRLRSAFAPLLPGAPRTGTLREILGLAPAVNRFAAVKGA